jgi:hypothetical protein
MLAASVAATWIAFFLTCAAPPRSPMLRYAKIFLALAFAWLLVEGIRLGMLTDDGASDGY